jgi:hypothetical protein
LRDQLGSLISYGWPLLIEGSVTDAVSQLLIVPDILPPKEDIRLANKQTVLLARSPIRR